MFKIYILAIGLISIAQSNAELNSDCAKGPSYWCDSIQNANKCNAFNHCLQTVWSTHNRYLEKNELKTSNNPTSCSNCVQCVSTDFLACPYVYLFKKEINTLRQSNIPAESICMLMKQCNDADIQDEHDNKQKQEQQQIFDNNGIEYKIDSRFKCGLHPRNWCDTLETAKRCDSFESCLSKWSKTDLKYKSKEVDTSLPENQVMSQRACGFCIFIFNKLQQVIQQNSTEVNLKEYLEGACSLLPTQEVSQKCVQEVDAYLPELYNMLRNNVDPGIICRVLKQCSDQNLVTVSPNEESKPKANNILKNIKIKILNEKEAIIKTPLQNQKNIVNSHLLGSKSETLVVELKRTMGVGCELCTIVMSVAKSLVENKQEDEKVLEFIEKQLCNRLGSLNNTCVEYVKQEGAEIIQLLAQAIDPSLICHAMGLCLKVQVSDDYINEKFYDLNVRNPLNCTLCKMVFEQVKKMLSEQTSQAKIIDYINVNLCAKVGKSRELCKSLIDSYGPLFMEIIARDVNPNQLCTMLGMCENGKDCDQTKPTDLKPVEDNTECVLCEFVLTLLQKYVSNNSSAPEVEKWLEYVCDNVMPVSIRNECSSFVETYGKIIISLITNQVSPDKVCTFIGLCKKSTLTETEQKSNNKFVDEEHLFRHRTIELAKQKAIAQRVKDLKNTDIKCTVCQYAIQYMGVQYQFDKTEKGIKFTIENACQLTPKSYRQHCDSFVNKHGIRIINTLEKYSDPLEVCASIKLCNVEDEEKPIGSEEKLIELVDLVPAKQGDKKDETKLESKNQSIECSLCIYAAELVDEKLKQNKTEEQIVKELELVCNLFPSSLKDQCLAFMNEYGPYVVQLVAADLDPQTACAALKLCDKSFAKDSLRHALLNRFQ